MNVLRTTELGKLEELHKYADEGEVKLHHLEKVGLVDGIGMLLSSTLTETSFLTFQARDEWEATLAKLPEFHAEEHEKGINVWVTGIPVGDFILLAPDDGVKRSSLQMFTKIDALQGRLILHGSQVGSKFHALRAYVEFLLHCPLTRCTIGDETCNEKCSCRCVRRRHEGFETTACYCSPHDAQ
ncbi:hypothetical protein [Streptomyces sp. NPDC017868]|uniref:hypothetical protein n=1 Tax=Streptomyces sp. NPDC017868 TaxID=3365014 RepID=UPI00378AD375